MKKIRVGVIYGGRSGEHDVSVASATSVIRHLDTSKYIAVPVHIEKSGRWVLGAAPPAISAGTETHGNQPDGTILAVEPSTAVTASGLDVIFPALHGPYGEDGTLQGLLELANVPYVGSGVLGSAVGMDKAVMKTLFAARGLPNVPYIVLLRREWERDSAGTTTRVSSSLRYPVFVKPANLGSSVGISKVKTEGELTEAIGLALEFDHKVVVEEGVPNAREIECAVLGNDDAEASVPGEIIPAGEFYDYDAKYVDDQSRLVIPAPLDAEQTADVRRFSIEAFRAIDGAGMARVDFLMEPESRRLYVNEVNTIPGFTDISMFPKLWGATGLSYPDLIDRLVALALERHASKQRLRTSLL